MECAKCGATIRRDDGRFCSHCGASLPDRPRISPEEWVTHPARFEELERHPQLASAMAVDVPRPSTARVIPFVFFAVFWCAIGGAVTLGFASAGGFLALAPLAMVIAGLVMVVRLIGTQLAFARAPLERKLAVAIDERTRVSGGGEHSSASTTYYVTLQTRDGARREVKATDGVAGFVTRGDIGVACLRANVLVAFHRIAV